MKNLRCRSMLQNDQNFNPWQQNLQVQDYNILQKLNKNLNELQKKYRKYSHPQTCLQVSKPFQIQKQKIKLPEIQSSTIQVKCQKKIYQYSIHQKQYSMQVKVPKQFKDSDIFRERTNHYLRFRIGQKSKQKQQTCIIDNNIRVRDHKPFKYHKKQTQSLIPQPCIKQNQMPQFFSNNSSSFHRLIQPNRSITPSIQPKKHKIISSFCSPQTLIKKLNHKLNQEQKINSKEEFNDIRIYQQIGKVRRV